MATIENSAPFHPTADHTERASQRRSMERLEPMHHHHKRSSIDDTVTYDTAAAKSKTALGTYNDQQAPETAKMLANFTSGEMEVGSRAQQLQMSEPVRRHLPIEQKKKIFNEWGAVLRHQDEVEQKVQKDLLL